jgi:hypothetical protein
MIMVPRQVQRSDFRSSVPYYGGRLTPAVIAGLGRPAPGTPLPPPPPPDPRPRQLATLEQLRGLLTDDEYTTIRERIVGRA